MKGSYTNWDLIRDVFKEVKKPLTVKEIWENAVKLGLDEKTNNNGVTPWNSIHSMFAYRKKIGNDEYIQNGKKWYPKDMKI